MGLFGKSQSRPKDLKTQVTEWRRKLRRESTALDSQIRGIRREEEKIKRSLKEVANKGNKELCVIYAKSLLRSRKAINKTRKSKAHLNSIRLNMDNQLAILRTTGVLQKSTQVMQSVQALVKVPEIAATMRELSKEMMKAGIMEEMLNDTFESVEDQDDIEEAAEEEIDTILWEVTAGQIGKAPPAAAGNNNLSTADTLSVSDEDEEDLEKMQKRLEILKG